MTPGQLAAQAGAQAAINHAASVIIDWPQHAMAWLTKVALRGQPFMAEDVWTEAEAAGLPSPPDRRAWGAVFSRAAKSGFIKRVGFAPMKQRHCHANPKSVWQISSTK